MGSSFEHFSFVLFNLVAVSVPAPKALYPLNKWFGTREINDEQPQGTPVGVTLAAGPNGNEGGSYQFDGHANSYIEFPNNGGLDVQHSITMLCWLYPKVIDKGSIFSYGINDQQWRVHFWMSRSGKLYAGFAHRNYTDAPIFKTDKSLARNQWHYVGTSYDHITGMASIWVNGERVRQHSIGASMTLATQDNVRMGADGERFFTGRMTAMQFFDAALTAKQINEVKESGLGKHLCHLVVYLDQPPS